MAAQLAQRLVVHRGWLAGGLLYGVVVYLMMHNVVISLSAIVPRPPTLSSILTGIIGHAFFVGVPAAWFARTRPAVTARAPASSRGSPPH